MLSIQAVRGLPRLRAPGIVPCIRGAVERGREGGGRPSHFYRQGDASLTLHFFTDNRSKVSPVLLLVTY